MAVQHLMRALSVDKAKAAQAARERDQERELERHIAHVFGRKPRRSNWIELREFG
uniref:Uncharacterized protein n=1 Tax=Candidatus Kentrum sp. TC TaxID=2126339 RepID=A0A451A9N7_9GAMM|nr:MAG: hypothetical protein BECKTC1821F_GA0114240_10794 [Candidatus Kentron sp. TC]